MNNKRIAIIGLGYVGLPLAVAFAEKYSVVGFDINEKRVAELKAGSDFTLEIEDDLLKSVLVKEISDFDTKGKGLLISSNSDDLVNCSIFIVTVPTPTDKHNRPVLTPLIKASETIANAIKEFEVGSLKLETNSQNEFQVHSLKLDSEETKLQTPNSKLTENAVSKFQVHSLKLDSEEAKLQTPNSKLPSSRPIVIYESTVYPGVTEEEMVPVLERVSGLKFNEDFFVGYSPERINPGDKEHTVTKILKVTSGSTPEIAEEVDQLYRSIIVAGTHKASSIKVAEAAKVIENSQRDINIAFVNELSKIFSRLGIDTHEVLEAAGTKWNFLKFKPGLVGGHCIGVDPYYLAQKAQEVGYHPEIILAGRRLNDGMGEFVASEVVKLLLKAAKPVKGEKCLILGFTFKENCPDVRNTKVIDIVISIQDYHMEPIVYDPWANPAEVMHEYGIEVVNNLPNQPFAAAILAVAHKEFEGLNIRQLVGDGVVYDVKGMLPKEMVDARL